MLRKIIIFSFICAFSTLFSYPSFATDAPSKSIRIVENGKSQTIILISEHASQAVLNVAKLLSEYLQQSTNVRIPIYADNTISLKQNITIHVGANAYVKELPLPFDKLDDDGFVLSFPDEKNIVIVGPTDWGTEFGVYEFLERYVGVRWLLPGSDGEHVPEHSTLDIPIQEVQQEPAFFSRLLSSQDLWSGKRDNDLARWAYRNRMHGRVKFHHNLLRLFPPEKYTTTHPEFFPIVKGKRFLPPTNDWSWKNRWQPCFSAPGIVEEAIKNICQYFSEHPEETSYSLGVNDGRRHCECEKCLARDSGKKNFLGYKDLSDRYFEWANAVVEGVLKKYPDRWFGCLAYSNIAEPPSRVSVHPHIIPYMTYDRMKWIDPGFEKEGEKITELWEKEVPILGWYDYIYGTPYLLPRVYFHKMAEYYRYGYRHGIRAMTAEAYPNWGEGPKLYVALKLQWNPELDVDTLLRDWYVCAVGEKAAPDLAAYYDFWEEFWTERIKKSRWFKRRGQYLLFKKPDYLALVCYKDLEHSRTLLEQVLAKTRTTKQRARAQILLRAFEYYEASAISYLGVVKNVRQPGKSREYYENMNKKRLILVNEFQNDPVLRHPVRFDDKRFPELLWGKKPGAVFLEKTKIIWGRIKQRVGNELS